MTCPICGGKGKSSGPRVAEYTKCWACRGSGVVSPCVFCDGTGRYTPSGLFNSERECPHCKGLGFR